MIQPPSPTPSQRIHALVFVVAFLLIEFLLLATGAPEALRGLLVDPDSYTRLLRVEALIESGRWFDGRELQLNAPLGFASHWTRPVDVLLIVLALPLTPFLGWRTGLYWAGYALSPLVALATFFLFARAVTPLVGRSMRPFAMIALLAQPGFLNYALPGRVDHHMLFLLTFVCVVGSMVRLLCRYESTATAEDGAEPGRALLTGVALGAGLWLSVEFLVVVAIVLAALGVRWILEGQPWATVGRQVTVATALTLLAILAVERGPAFFAVEYDRVSIVHLVAVGVAAAVWIGCARVKASESAAVPLRTGAAALGLLLGGALVFALFPDVFRDPLRSGDPVVWTRYWSHLEELTPLLPGAVGWSSVVGYLGSTVLVIPFLVHAVRRRDGTGRGWQFVGLALAVYLVLGIRQIRFVPYVGVLLAIGVTGVLAYALDGLDRMTRGLGHSLARAFVSAACLGGVLLLGGALRAGERVAAARTVAVSGQSRAPPCSFPELARSLAAVAGGESRSVVLAYPDMGPEIAYRTGLSVVAAPYHRMEDGIRAALSLSGTEAELRRTLTARKVDYVVLCPARDRMFFRPPAADGDTAGQRTPYDRLLAGAGPAWLREESPSGLTRGARLFRFTLADASSDR